MSFLYAYNKETGIFSGVRFNADEMTARRNIAEGEDLFFGAFDYLSKRLDIETRELVDYQPPAPDSDHEWIHDDEQGNRVRRWRLKPEAAERQARKAAARARIAELERKQERALREHVLGVVPTDDDRAAGAMTLQEIQDEIAAQRAIINATDSNAT